MFFLKFATAEREQEDEGKDVIAQGVYVIATGARDYHATVTDDDARTPKSHCRAHHFASLSSFDRDCPIRTQSYPYGCCCCCCILSKCSTAVDTIAMGKGALSY